MTAIFTSLWHWFTTVSSGDIARLQDNALIAIASVAAVIWTGGLIAWQLKQWTLVRNVALDFAATAFMGTLFALFLHPLSLRYVAIFFLAFYVVGSIVLIRQNRDWKDVKKKANDKADAKKAPPVNLITDERWVMIAKSNRVYAYINLAILFAYLPVIIWPYPTCVAWFATILLFFGYQLTVYNLNMAQDKPLLDPTTLNTQATVMGQLNAALELLKQIASKQ